ncbi:class I SAM-dependent methyltransferase [Cellulomonas shaoxiangyii]|uniref:Methyltransferase domain-containing protein n=1 Tax=Cellulomonas shaoxiangyii TaxID=2566013 RepID=A0A4P7SLU0_9CELL|nr:methyltransferase [Cellulomonas shaoxiangyii]QCB94921.1 methyltransferase domain-containing protein [Cellulomonas shaoxiangyii]TGY77385.1 methyltransferase domain-containing protein [Cellulomonas shaoxiangyii]
MSDVLDDLRRHPDLEAPNLYAVDATDRLVLDEAAPALADAADGTVVVIGDRYGALTLGAIARHGVTGLRTHQDRLTGELALRENAERLGLGGFTSHALTPDLVAGARLVLLQLPRSLDALDEIAALVAEHADPAVVVVAGGRVKHMTTAMNDVLARHLAVVEARLARQKSRVLVASSPRPAVERPARRWPERDEHPDLGITVCAHGGAFAGAGVDIGTRALLAHLDALEVGEGTAVDLGCGTGVLAVALARLRPGLAVTATDESAAAVASARATVEANGVGDRVHVTRAVGTDGIPDASVDLVLLNPPFHVGATVHPGVARALFADAARVLRPGGELWAVWNSHLRYRPTLEQVVGPTRQLGRDPKFTVTASTRR